MTSNDQVRFLEEEDMATCASSLDQVRLFSQILEENICSKQDLLETEGRLRIEIENVRKEIKELDFKIEGVRKDLTIQIGECKTEIIKWFIGTFLVAMGMITGILALVVKVVHP